MDIDDADRQITYEQLQKQIETSANRSAKLLRSRTPTIDSDFKHALNNY